MVLLLAQVVSISVLVEKKGPGFVMETLGKLVEKNEFEVKKTSLLDVFPKQSIVLKQEVPKKTLFEVDLSDLFVRWNGNYNQTLRYGFTFKWINIADTTV